MKRTRTAAVLAVTMLAAPLAACSTPPAVASGTMRTSETTSASGMMSGLPEKDIARWVMPMDQYSAASLVRLEPTDDASYLATPKNMSSFPALSVAIAKRYGYTALFIPGPTQDPQTSVKLNRIGESTPGLDTTLQACRDESRKTFDGIKASDIYNTTSVWSPTRPVRDRPEGHLHDATSVHGDLGVGRHDA